MPLIVLTGHPSSGKTTISKILSDFLTEKLISDNRNSTNFNSLPPTPQIRLISDDLSEVFSRQFYAESSGVKEREQRGFLRSEVQRFLTKDSLVICDSLNYIKGFRYELFCIAKSAKTTYCVIHCEANLEILSELNFRKPEDSARYCPEVLHSLVERFEPPDAKNRWDSPLFTLPVTVLQATDEQQLMNSLRDLLPLNQIYQCLYKGEKLKANQSTVPQPLAGTNFLYELDRVTQEIIQCLMSEQNTAMPGDLLSVPGSKDKVEMRNRWTLIELTRLKRQYITYIKSHPVENREKIAKLFVNFINNNQRC